jgi:hypothetical protein
MCYNCLKVLFGGRLVMKKLLLGSVLLGIFFLILNGACYADDKVYQFRLPDYVEPIHGTWIHEKLENDPWYEHKWVYFKWGYAEAYTRIGDESPADRYTYILVEKWQDSDGSVWYKELNLSVNGGHHFWLVKISNAGTVLEATYGSNDFPGEMDPGSQYYRIFQRKQ